MNSREVCVWLDRRWYDALSSHLKKEGTTVEEKLEGHLDAMIDQLPEQVREEINREIGNEEQRQEAEAARQLTVLHVREDGHDGYFQIDRPMGSLTVAKQLHGYLRGDAGMDRSSFAECCEPHLHITAGEFDRLAGVHMEHPEKATGAFELDFDKREFSAAHPTEGWQTYSMKDASTAVYHTFRPDSMDWPKRTRRFTDKLAGSEIASAGHLSARQIAFADEISEIEGRLNFYIDTGFDVDAVFGTQVCTGENDDSLNVYAEYDMAAGQVFGELEVDLHRADGREEAVPYTLNAVEKAMLLRKMEAYCLKQTGMTLKDYIAPEVFQDYAGELRQNAGRVTAVLDVDLDRGTLSTLAGAEGWQTYTVHDVCVAAWQATLPNHVEWEDWRYIFSECLQDKLVEQETSGMVPPSGQVM